MKSLQYYSPCHVILSQTESTGALLLGSMTAVVDQKLLKQHNIKSVLTAAAGLEVKLDSRSFKHKVLNILDIGGYQISKHFDESFRFIDENLKCGSVLVHCAAGISRSATIEALEFVKSKRNIICPNAGFIRQLRFFSLMKQKSSLDNKKKIDSDNKQQKNINNAQNIQLTGKSIFNQEQECKQEAKQERNPLNFATGFSFANNYQSLQQTSKNAKLSSGKLSLDYFEKQLKPKQRMFMISKQSSRKNQKQNYLTRSNSKFQ